MDSSIRLHQVLPLVERQHSVIEHLRARHPKITTAGQLGALVGVSQRTIHRDVARMREAGIPLEVVTGVRGGYRIAARDRDGRLTLNPGEVSALLASLVAIGPYSSASAQSAFAKPTSALVPAPDEAETPPSPCRL